jgi:hypothetical protein
MTQALYAHMIKFKKYYKKINKKKMKPHTHTHTQNCQKKKKKKDKLIRRVPKGVL